MYATMAIGMTDPFKPHMLRRKSDWFVTSFFLTVVTSPLH